MKLKIFPSLSTFSLRLNLLFGLSIQFQIFFLLLLFFLATKVTCKSKLMDGDQF